MGVARAPAGDGYHLFMPTTMFETTREIFEQGGWVMWPLLALSVVSVALSLERELFWLSTNRPGRRNWLDRLADRLRAGDWAAARAITAKDGSVYGRITAKLLDRTPSEAALIELIELERHRIERFGVGLSTIITAAPLFGILGTVLGIIDSFQLLGASGASPISDPTLVAGGIAKALITTAFGLIVSAFTLFPYAMTRARSARSIGRLEAIGAAAIQGAAAKARSGA